MTQVVEEIARFFGEPAGKCQVLIDEFGERYAARALEMVQTEAAQGKTIRNPFGLMISKLRSGEVQAVAEREEAEDAEKDAQATWTQDRWCSQQHDPAVDTIAKRLARGAGLAVMTCAGCGEDVPL